MEIDELEKVIQPIFKNLVKLTYSISDVPYVERFYVIPGNDGPRWIVPCDPKYGMPVLAKWRPWDRSSRIKWEFVKAAYKLRCLGHLSGVQQVGVHGSSSINCGSITAIEEGLLIPSIYIGTPGVTSKAVTGLVAKGSGVTHSIVKTPIGYLSGRRIQHEANILASLNTLNQGVAPQLLYYDDVENILVQQVVDGNAPSVKLTSAHNSYIEKLISTHTYTCIKERAEELLPRISRLFGNDEARERVLVNVLCTLNDQQQIPNAWCHGDFTPWNIKQ